MPALSVAGALDARLARPQAGGVAPGARTAYGLTRAAIRDNNPVVLLEPRALYGERENIEPGEESLIQLGIAETVREGSDVTLVALGQTVKVALDAEAAGSWSGEVIDLLSLMPWDKETVLSSVRRTGRLVVIEENQFTGGWGTEIASFVSWEGVRRLDGADTSHNGARRTGPLRTRVGATLPPFIAVRSPTS